MILEAKQASRKVKKSGEKEEGGIFYYIYFCPFPQFFWIYLKTLVTWQEFIFMIKQTYLLGLNPYKENNANFGSSSI